MLKNSTFAAVFSTTYLILLVILVLIGHADAAALMLLLSPLLVVWLVYIVLRYGQASGGRTFGKYFYDDVNMRVDNLRD